VLSGGGNPERAARAMRSVIERLVRRDERLVLLFTPPFDRDARDPGYIKGYHPGVRENGGQYTHAAVWVAWALAELGQHDEAFEIFGFLNPISHSDSAERAAHYRVEPYAVAADVYGAPPFTGQGGWTWYTGSSSWLYRLGIEGLLGLRKQGSSFEVDPRVPAAWPGFRLTCRFGPAAYEIRVENPAHVSHGILEVSLDGRALPDQRIPITTRRGKHVVLVRMG
jgi:cyclic beta-1,2-glucan synthetase